MRDPADERATVAAVAERARGHAGLRRIVRNVAWLIAERGLVLAANLAVGVWLINTLGPERYGTYAYAVSFAALFSALATFGLDSIVVRELSRPGRAGEAGTILGTAFAMRAAAAVGTLLLVVAASRGVDDDPALRVLVAVVALSLLAEPANVVDLWFQSRIESRFAVWVRAGVTLVAAGARVALILAGATVLAFAWLYALQALAVAAGLLAAFAVRRPTGLRLRRSARIARELAREGWPLIVAGLSVTVYMRIDRLMLEWMADSAAVGTYATAATLSEAFNFLPVVIAASLFPVVVRSRGDGDPARYRRRLQALYDAMALLGYAVALPLTLLAGPLVRGLFTADYAAAAGILQVHVWSFVFVALGVARSRYLIAEHRVRFSMVATVLGGVVNVGLNVVLIPTLGGLGAAIATLVAYALAAWAVGFAVPSLRPMVLQQTLALGAPCRPLGVWRGLREVF